MSALDLCFWTHIKKMIANYTRTTSFKIFFKRRKKTTVALKGWTESQIHNMNMESHNTNILFCVQVQAFCVHTRVKAFRGRVEAFHVPAEALSRSGRDFSHLRRGFSRSGWGFSRSHSRQGFSRSGRGFVAFGPRLFAFTLASRLFTLGSRLMSRLCRVPVQALSRTGPGFSRPLRGFSCSCWSFFIQFDHKRRVSRQLTVGWNCPVL